MLKYGYLYIRDMIKFRVIKENGNNNIKFNNDGSLEIYNENIILKLFHILIKKFNINKSKLKYIY